MGKQMKSDTIGAASNHLTPRPKSAATSVRFAPARKLSGKRNPPLAPSARSLPVKRIGALGAFILVTVTVAPMTRAADDASGQSVSPVQATTTSDPFIPTAELESRLLPLTRDELQVEADAWRALLKAKLQEIAAAEIQVIEQNKQIQEAKEQAATAQEKVEEAQKESEATQPAESEEVAPPAEGEAAKPAEVAEAEKVQEEAKEEKKQTLEGINKLKEERAKIVDRFNIVLNAWEKKGGDISEHEQYVTAVSGIKLDVSDASAAWVAVLGWLKSEEGGLRWARNLALFVVTLLAFWILARIVGRAVRRAMRMVKNASDLLREFTETMSRRAVLLVGLIVALAQLEVNIGPLMAAIGAAGFVVAFALQGTLSNFASGLLILIYRPYDVGDVVDVAGVSGTVESMNLVSSTIKTFDNKKMVVPNNAIWGNVITNVTGHKTRRVDMVFGISYGDDLDKAASILEDTLAQHALVLKDPAPTVRMNELADSSVNLICRPWTKTPDYWTVYWDVMRTVKQRFDAEGISIPFPQRDVHVHQLPAPASGG